MNLDNVDDRVIGKLLSDYVPHRNYDQDHTQANGNDSGENNTDDMNVNNESNVVPVEQWLQQDVLQSFPSVRNVTKFRMNDKVFIRDAHVAWKQYLELIQQIRANSPSASCILKKDPLKPRIDDELWKTCFPLFVYIFIQIYEYGYILIARKFFIDNYSKFLDKTNQINILRSMETTLNRQELDRGLLSFKNLKFRIMITEQSFGIIAKFLKHEKHLPILQIFASCMDFRVMTSEEYGNRQNFQKSPINPVQFSFEENLFEENLDNQNNSEEMNRILHVIKSARDLNDSDRDMNITSHDVTVCLLKFQSPQISSVAISKDLSKIFAANENSEIIFWDCDLTDELQYYSSRICRNWKRTPVRQLSHELDFKYIDHEQIISGGHGGQQQQQQFENHPQVKTKVDPIIFRGHSDPVHEMSMLFDSNTLLSCSSDATIRAWDLNSGSSTAIYQGHPQSIWSMDSQEYGCFVSGGSDAVAMMWDIERTVPLRMYSGHTMDINQIRYHPNGNYFATASADKSIILWDVHQARQVRMLVHEHQLSVHSIRFSSCGKFLASGSDDGYIRMWDISMGTCLQMFKNRRETPIRCVTLAPDNHLLAWCDARSTKLRVLADPLNLNGNRRKPPSNIDCKPTEEDGCGFGLSLLQLQFIRPKVLLAIAKHSGNK